MQNTGTVFCSACFCTHTHILLLLKKMMLVGFPLVHPFHCSSYLGLDAFTSNMRVGSEEAFFRIICWQIDTVNSLICCKVIWSSS